MPGRPHLARRGGDALGYQQRPGQMINVADYVLNCASLTTVMITVVQLTMVGLHACQWSRACALAPCRATTRALHVPVLRGVGGKQGAPFGCECRDGAGGRLTRWSRN
jgi:hypothetical protein